MRAFKIVGGCWCGWGTFWAKEGWPAAEAGVAGEAVAELRPSRLGKTSKPDRRRFDSLPLFRLPGCRRMRGTDHQTGRLFGYLSPEMMVPRDHPLR
jgi:hypothetical protein